MSRKQWRTGTSSLVGLVFVAAGLTGCASMARTVTDVVNGMTGIDPSRYSCDDLAKDAVDISSNQNDDPYNTLIKVRNPYIVEDHRKAYSLPSGDGETLILSCIGAGVWASGEPPSPVDLWLTVDSDGEEFVFWQEE